VILEKLEVTPEELRLRTGWEIRPEGACKADRCVPLPEDLGDRIDVRVLAERLGMALVHDDGHGLWALGPEAGDRALPSAGMPELTLPDREGNPFSLSSLVGSKVLLLAWASW
jgi:hypothetical protein